MKPRYRPKIGRNLENQFLKFEVLTTEQPKKIHAASLSPLN